MGPFAGQILADLGAEVVKIEPPGGDIARNNSRSPMSGRGAMYVNNNRNKKTISVDLKTPEGLEVVNRLIAGSDVFLHNMRVEAVNRLGLDYERVRAIRPDIIYCAAIGFGQKGRYRARPAFDDIIQAASGLAGLSLHFGQPPQFFPTIVADKVAALYVVYGVLAALLARSRGETTGLKVEAPMFEALVSFLLNEHLADATFSDDVESAGYNRILSANRRPYRTADGWIAVLPYTREHWERFLRETGRTDILDADWFAEPTQRTAHIDFMYGEVASAMSQRTTLEWMAVLSELDIPCSEISSFADLLRDPHLEDVGFFSVDEGYPAEIRRALPQPVTFEGVESRPDSAAPVLGAHTREVLAACGYSPGEIDALERRGVVQAAPARPGSAAES